MVLFLVDERIVEMGQIKAFVGENVEADPRLLAAGRVAQLVPRLLLQPV